MPLSHVIVFVSQMPRSVAFYRDRLHLPLKFESPEWTEFATGATTLALHLSATGTRPAAQPTAPSAQPGFSVPDLRATHAELLAAGVTCRMAPKDLHGTLLAEYEDPDGLPFSLSQARTA